MERRRPREVKAEILDCGVDVSKFELPLRCNVLFRTNTYRKCMNSLIYPHEYVLISIPVVMLRG